MYKENALDRRGAVVGRQVDDPDQMHQEGHQEELWGFWCVCSFVVWYAGACAGVCVGGCIRSPRRGPINTIPAHGRAVRPSVHLQQPQATPQHDTMNYNTIRTGSRQPLRGSAACCCCGPCPPCSGGAPGFVMICDGCGYVSS